MNKEILTHNLINYDRVIYTPSIFAKSALCYLQEIGTLQALKKHTSNREYLDSFLFFIVNSGNGILEYNGTTYELNEHACVFIDCHNPYSHTTSSNLWNISWIHFSSNMMSKIYTKFVERGGKPTFTSKNFNEYKICYNDLMQLSKSKGHIKDMEINEKLTHLLSLLIEETVYSDNEEKLNNKTKILNEVKNYITINYNTKISLDKLAKNFFINKFYLLRLFKEKFGITINYYLLKVRITNAKYFLRFTDEPIEKIGIDCGIGTITYFSRIFKKIEGISPSTYRKQW